MMYSWKIKTVSTVSSISNIPIVRVINFIKGVMRTPEANNGHHDITQSSPHNITLVWNVVTSYICPNMV